MISGFYSARLLAAGCLLAYNLAAAGPQALLADIEAVHDPVKRSEKALAFADTAFDDAKDFYSKGKIQEGDAQLEAMTRALSSCVESLQTARKARFYKKAEMNVALLQRRLKGLLDDLDTTQRGWAEYTQRKLEDLHDQLLSGVMRK
jgi:hypothetical protein